MNRAAGPFLYAVVLASLFAACDTSSKDDDDTSMSAAIEEACSGHCARGVECGFEEASNEDACSQECIDSLTANLEFNQPCTEADIALYSCLSTASCESIPVGTSCEPEIEASMSACESGEPETSSG